MRRHLWRRLSNNLILEFASFKVTLSSHPLPRHVHRMCTQKEHLVDEANTLYRNHQSILSDWKRLWLKLRQAVQERWKVAMFALSNWKVRNKNMVLCLSMTVEDKTKLLTTVVLTKNEKKWLDNKWYGKVPKLVKGC